MTLRVLLLLIALMGNLSSCQHNDDEKKSPELAVTNTYLQAAVADLCGGQSEVLCLTLPGMCPGHFDISPETVDQLRQCKLLLRFDFQESLDESLARLRKRGLRISEVRAMPGLCVPGTYLAACRDVCQALAHQYPERQARYQQRLVEIQDRLKGLTDQLRLRISHAGLENVGVITSTHQAEFARWLGFQVVDTFPGRDVADAAAVQTCLQKARNNSIRLIIANRQEGTALAEALAERTGAQVVVFSNFPDPGSGGRFDSLLQDNVAAALQKAKL